MSFSVGRILNKLREDSQISQGMLAYGLCSVPDLSRIENEDKQADRFLLQALFERLGKSFDRLEMTVTSEEYQIYTLRHIIWEQLDQGQYNAAEKSLKEYQLYSNSDKAIHKQYILMLQALYEAIVNKDTERAQQLLAEAADATLIESEPDRWKAQYLSMQELRILLIKAYLMIEEKRYAEGLQILKNLEQYISRSVTDSVLKVNLYPVCTWLMGRLYYAEHRMQEAYDMCQRAQSCLAEQGVINLMDRILNIKEKCLLTLPRDEVSESELAEVHQQQEALAYAGKFAEFHGIAKDILCVMLESHKEELILCDELIHELREAQGMTQEMLCEDICAQETLSRIESGKRSPSKKNVHALLKKLGSSREIMYGSVVTDDYEVYDRVFAYKGARLRVYGMRCEQILEELENKLDLSVPMNRQFIERVKIEKQIGDKEISNDEAIEKLGDILRYTMKGYQGTIYRIPFREEVVILNMMAIYYEKGGRIWEGLSIYKQIIEQYRKSKVSHKYHALSAMLIYRNFAASLEKADMLDEAEQAAKEGIWLSLTCGRGDISGIILSNLSCVFEKRADKVSIEQAELSMKHGYYLLKMSKCSNYADQMRTIYKKIYLKKLD